MRGEYLGTRFDPICDQLDELLADLQREAGARGEVNNPLCQRLAGLIGLVRDEAAAEFTDPAAKAVKS